MVDRREPSAPHAGNITAFEFALAGVDVPAGEASDVAIQIVEAMRSMVVEVEPAPVVDEGLHRYLSMTSALKASPRTERQPAPAASFADITPEELKPESVMFSPPVQAPEPRGRADRPESDASSDWFETSSSPLRRAYDAPETAENPAIQISDAMPPARRPKGRKRSLLTSAAVLAPLASAIVAASLVGGFLWWRWNNERSGSIEAGLSTSALVEEGGVGTAATASSTSPERVTATSQGSRSGDTGGVQSEIVTSVIVTSSASTSSSTTDQSATTSTTTASTTVAPTTGVATTEAPMTTTTASPPTTELTAPVDATIGGRVVYGGDVPAEDVFVDLLSDVDGDGEPEEWQAFDRTASDGSYAFSVDDGCYVVEFIAPQGYLVDGRTQNQQVCVKVGDRLGATGILLER